MSRLFLSYARGDDESFVKRLRADLAAQGFSVWFDRESLLSRGLTFHQEIKDAIRTEIDRLIYVAGPQASLSPYVREEWEFALACDNVVVTPILRLGEHDTIPGELSLLHCEDFRDDAKYAPALARLIASLRQPNPRLGGLFAVPNLPAHFLSRPELMRRVRDALLVDLQKPQVIASADSKIGMQGMGGIGKSVLAAALARCRDVRQAYPDGVVWIACGQHLTDDDLLGRQRDLTKYLGGDITFASLAQGQSLLRELLKDKAVLLVLDDVWRAADANGFDVIGPRCRMLVTTRDRGILNALHGELVPVSLFLESEALQLLADAAGVESGNLPPEAHEVVKSCGCLPLAVALCGGMIKQRSGDVTSVLERLQRADIDKIADRESINEQHRSIWRAMQASVEALPEDEQLRFAELAVFLTDRIVPAAAIATLWCHTGRLTAADTEDLLISLGERSLVQLDQRTTADGKVQRCLTLHDLLYDYAARVAGDEKSLHRTLLAAYQKSCPDGWYAGPDDSYFFQSVCQHLATATGNWDESIALLSDLRFVEARCRVGQVFDLVADYRLARTNLPQAQAELREEREAKECIARWVTGITEYAHHWSAIRNQVGRAGSAGPLSCPEPPLPISPSACSMAQKEDIDADRRRILADPTQLDVLAEFAGFTASQCYPLMEFGQRPGFVAQHAFDFALAGPLHEAAQVVLSVLNTPCVFRQVPDGVERNPNTACLRTLEGHDSYVNCVTVSPDGLQVVTGSNDLTVRVWDVASGTCLRTFSGHSDSILCVCMTPDGRRVISGAGNPNRYLGEASVKDNTLRVWAEGTAGSIKTLEGHGDRILCVDVTPDGRLAISGSSDRSLRLWDVDSGQCLRCLNGHEKSVNAVCLTPDGRRAISVSDDGCLRVWDVQHGICLSTLHAHDGGATCVSITPDGRRAISGGCDLNLRVWNVENGACLYVLEGHTSWITCVGMTPDGRRAVSGSESIRVWDLERGTCLRTLQGLSSHVECMSVSSDGRRAVSVGLNEWSAHVWNLKCGADQRVLNGHVGRVYSLGVGKAGLRAVSVADDGCVVVWDMKARKHLHRIKAFDHPVTCVSVTPDGRYAVSGGGRFSQEDNALRVWDLESGELLRKLECADLVWCVCVTPDGRRAAATGAGKRLLVWDIESGACLLCVEGRDYEAFRFGMMPDGRHAVLGCNDGTLRTVDLDSGEILRTVEGQGEMVSSLCVTPDGRQVVCSGANTPLLRVFDLETGACLRTLAGHSRTIWGGTVTPDGRYAVSASFDKTVRFWDIETGACAAVYCAHGLAGAVATSPDGIMIGLYCGEVLFAAVTNMPAGIIRPVPEAVYATDEAYEQYLRRGFDLSHTEKGEEEAVTSAYHAALVVHLEKNGNLKRLVQLHQDTLAIMQRLASDDPWNPRWRQGLVAAARRVTQIQLRRFHIVSALYTWLQTR